MKIGEIRITTWLSKNALTKKWIATDSAYVADLIIKPIEGEVINYDEDSNPEIFIELSVERFKWFENIIEFQKAQKKNVK